MASLTFAKPCGHGDTQLRVTPGFKTEWYSHVCVLCSRQWLIYRDEQNCVTSEEKIIDAKRNPGP